MTGAEQLMQIGMQRGIEQGMRKGIEQGIEQGIEKGTLEGERAILKKLLARRFGLISLGCLEKIQNADSETLLLWGERILDAKKIEEVFSQYH